MPTGQTASFVLPLSPKTTVPGGAGSTAGASVCHLFSKLLLEINKLVDDLAGGVTETPPETWTPAFLGRFVSFTGSPCWAVRLSGLPDALRTAGAAPDENHFCFPQLFFFFFFFGDSEAWQAAAFETWPEFPTFVLLRFQSFPSLLLSGKRKD